MISSVPWHIYLREAYLKVLIAPRIQHPYEAQPRAYRITLDKYDMACEDQILLLINGEFVI